MIQEVSHRTITFGCDPEFFFSKKGSVIGSEKVLPENGMDMPLDKDESGSTDNTSVGIGVSRLVIDGVQAELNPRPNTCRANLANEISSCFRQLHAKMKESGVEADFSRAVKVSDEEMASLSEKSKTFGCSASYNANNKGRVSHISVNPAVYKIRAAGGHIHIGDSPTAGANSPVGKVLKQPERVIPLLDVLLGNTCVMIDTDAANAERRKVYGKAGEYRKPKHGLEYRTLSNFWLRNYVLMSMVMGITRQAVEIAAMNPVEQTELEKEIFKCVDIKEVERAINTNDAILARKNFDKIRHLIVQAFPHNLGQNSLAGDTMAMFEHFLSKPVDYWFDSNVVEHWIKLPEGHSGGFEDFLQKTVAKDMTNPKTV